MQPLNVALVIGSLRKDSFNRRLGSALTNLTPQEHKLTVLEIGDLPLYNQDDDLNPHESVRRLKREISASQALIFVTPEYNRSIPGVLKNALDHASRPYGQNAWAGKPAGMLGISVGPLGTSMAQQHLRNILAYLDVPTLGQPEIFLQLTDDLFDSAGNIGRPDTKQHLQVWVDRYFSWVQKLVGG